MWYNAIDVGVDTKLGLNSWTWTFLTFELEIESPESFYYMDVCSYNVLGMIMLIFVRI